MAECQWNISDDCHACKKKWKVCKACWQAASEEDQQLYLKELNDGEGPEAKLCQTKGCWNWLKEGGDFCDDCLSSQRKDRSRSPRRQKTLKTIIQDQGLDEDEGIIYPPKSSRSAQKTNDPNAINEKANPKIEALRKMRTSAIAEIITGGVAELERRAAAQTVFQ